MKSKTLRPYCWTGKNGWNAANRTGNAITVLRWLRYVASYDGWPERAAAYRGAP
jgi:hypothetical protein